MRGGLCVLTVGLVVSLSGCRGSEPSEPQAQPSESVSIDSTPEAGDGPGETRAAVTESVAAYLGVRDTRRGRVTDRLLEVATAEWAEEVMGNYRTNVLRRGDVQTGRPELSEVRSVDLTAEHATVTACVDNGSVFIVKRGGTIGDGAIGGPRMINNFELVVEGEAWKVGRVTSPGRRC